MILRLAPETLRKMADQLDAYAALEAGGADHQPPKTRLTVDGRPLAYLYWHDDSETYLAEFIDFTPGDAEPLVYHDQKGTS